jgi:hypothetical protein
MSAFRECSSLTSITIPASVKLIEAGVFMDCPKLTAVYFEGDAMELQNEVFIGSDQATVYYLAGASGWGATAGGRPAVLWNPQANTDGADFGVKAGQFGFTVTGAAGLVIVAEAASDLNDPVWVAISKITLDGSGSFYFADPEWTNYLTRIYRFRSP